MNRIQSYFFLSLIDYLDLQTCNSTFVLDQYWHKMYKIHQHCNLMKYKFTIQFENYDNDIETLIEIRGLKNWFKKDCGKIIPYLGNFTGLITLGNKVRVCTMSADIDYVIYLQEKCKLLHHITEFDLQHIPNMFIREDCLQMLRSNYGDALISLFVSFSPIDGISPYTFKWMNVSHLTIRDGSDKIDYRLCIDICKLTSFNILLDSYKPYAISLLKDVLRQSILINQLQEFSLHIENKSSIPDYIVLSKYPELQDVIDCISNMKALTSLRLGFNSYASQMYEYVCQHLPVSLHTFQITSYNQEHILGYTSHIHPSNQIKTLYVKNYFPHFQTEYKQFATLFPGIEHLIIMDDDPKQVYRSHKIIKEGKNILYNTLFNVWSHGEVKLQSLNEINPKLFYSEDVNNIIQSFPQLKTIDFQCHSSIRQKLPIQEFKLLLQDILNT